MLCQDNAEEATNARLKKNWFDHLNWMSKDDQEGRARVSFYLRKNALRDRVCSFRPLNAMPQAYPTFL